MREWLIRIRRTKDLTQLTVAGQAGISRAYYAQLELAQRTPSIRVAKRLAGILDFDWTSFFEEQQP